MKDDGIVIKETLLISNIFALTKAVLEKVGLEYCAPIPSTIQDEIISQSLLNVSKE